MTIYSLDTDTITKLRKKHPGNQAVLDRFRKEIRWNSLFLQLEGGARLARRIRIVSQFADVAASLPRHLAA
jgi:hypothetical protein